MANNTASKNNDGAWKKLGFNVIEEFEGEDVDARSQDVEGLYGIHCMSKETTDEEVETYRQRASEHTVRVVLNVRKKRKNLLMDYRFPMIGLQAFSLVLQMMVADVDGYEILGVFSAPTEEVRESAD